MKAHPIANVWPMLDDDKLDELADDIRSKASSSPSGRSTA